MPGVPLCYLKASIFQILEEESNNSRYVEVNMNKKKHKRNISSARLVVAITDSLVSFLYKYYTHLAHNVITAIATTDNFCTNGSQK